MEGILFSRKTKTSQGRMLGRRSAHPSNTWLTAPGHIGGKMHRQRRRVEMQVAMPASRIGREPGSGTEVELRSVTVNVPEEGTNSTSKLLIGTILETAVPM
jgi:hypothetical protein